MFLTLKKKTLVARDRLGRTSGRGSPRTVQDVLACVPLTSGQRFTGHVAEWGSLLVPDKGYHVLWRGSNECRDYFYRTEGKIILQTWCKGLKHVVPSQGGWQVMLFIPGTAHSWTMFESLRKEFVGCFWLGKTSCNLMVFHDLCKDLSSPRVGNACIWSQEKGFGGMSLVLWSLYIGQVT